MSNSKVILSLICVQPIPVKNSILLYRLHFANSAATEESGRIGGPCAAPESRDLDMPINTKPTYLVVGFDASGR